jgi:hypothetical protein
MTHCLSIVLAVGLSLSSPISFHHAETATIQAPSAETTPDQDVLFELRLKDGSVIYGFVQTETADRIVVKTVAGASVDVERATIATLQVARGEVVNGEFRPADSNATRLLFAPTGRSLPKGQGYIGVYEFLLPFVQVGVTDRLSMGVGTPLVFFGDESGRPVWITPKYQFYKGPRTSAAVGVMHFFVVGENAKVGLAYTVATTGTDDNAVSAGLGWAYSRYTKDEFDNAHCFGATPAGAVACAAPARTTHTSGSPVAMLGGERRLTRRVKVVTENYVFKSGGILSVGVRFLGERLSADLGVFAPLSAEFTVLAPVVNFVWSFGK